MRRTLRGALAAALAALALALTLTACGASSSYSVAGGAAAASGTAAEAPAAENRMLATADTAASSSQQKSAGTQNEAKLIRTASLEMEATDFDSAAAALAKLVKDCGGYFESSSVDSYGGGYRSGSYTVRVPADKFDAFRSQAGTLCHLLSQSASTQDVSESYYDNAGRLKTQQIKLERLQALLAKASKMEDIITLEDAISQTEQEIDSLSGELRHVDALVDYASVSVSLQEVYRLSNTEEPVEGFSARFATALRSGWEGFLAGMQELLVALAYSWAWLVILLLAVLVVLGIVRRRRRTRKLRQQSVPPVQKIQLGGQQDPKEKP
jgi:hypothetical protein